MVADALRADGRVITDEIGKESVPLDQTITRPNLRQ